MVKIQNRMEHASQHLINAKSTVVIKIYQAVKKIPVKNHGVVKFDYKESL